MVWFGLVWSTDVRNKLEDYKKAYLTIRTIVIMVPKGPNNDTAITMLK